MDERYTTVAAIDIGTSKVACAIAHIGGEHGTITVIGKGTAVNAGMRKGVVTDIEKTGQAIKAAVDAAERLSGYHIEHATITVSGAHVEGQNSSGQVAVANPDREIRDDDVDRVLEVCRAIAVPSSRMLLNVLPSSYIVDGQEGIQQPRGMVAYRLEARAHLITAGSTAVQNLEKCVQYAGIAVDDYVPASLAAAELTLTDTERDLGTVLVDIGAETCDIAVFYQNAVVYTAVLPIGGAFITRDVAIGLKTSLLAAEELKTNYGTCDLRTVTAGEQYTVPDEPGGRRIDRVDLARIIEARMSEIFEMIAGVIVAAGPETTSAGVVLTGGGAKLAGIEALARNMLKTGVRVASPEGPLVGILDDFQGPAQAAVLGLFSWVAVGLDESAGIEEPSSSFPGRVASAFKGFFGRFRR
jgi:cell division protein FtsA